MRASESQLTDPVYKLKGYHYYHVEAEKKGYSGVAVFCKKKPLQVKTESGFALGQL